MPNHRLHSRRPAPGVSLVEALVALAVMSIGMLALVGVQSTMRLNSDLAKQRTEATRIASEEIETLRSFQSVPVVAGQPGISYDEIADRAVANYVPPGGIGNTSYRVVRNVTDLVGSQQKIVSVQVLWTDRTNQPQTVTLDSAISATAPTLGAVLVVPHRESPSSRRRGRHVSIPVDAVDQGDGSSRFVPPGSVGVAWYFNNLSGVMQACDDLGASCVLATLVSGTVRYHLADAATDSTLDGADAERPQGPARNLAPGPGAMAMVSAVNGAALTCYAASFDAAALAAGPPVHYVCAVTAADVSGWGGQINPVPVNADSSLVVFANDAANVRACRYTPDLPSTDDLGTTANEADPNGEFIANADHPKKYCMERPRNAGEGGLACTGKRVQGNLINQNFLLIQGDRSCPSETGGTDPLINGNTQQHLPAP